MMAEDYGDLDSEKVVLSFRGRGMDEEINCVDKCLKEVIARRISEKENQPTPQVDTTENEEAMEFTARTDQKASGAQTLEAIPDADEEDGDIEIKLVSTLNMHNVTPYCACGLFREIICSDYLTQMNTSRKEDAGATPGACQRAVREIKKRQGNHTNKVRFMTD